MIEGDTPSAALERRAWPNRRQWRASAGIALAACALLLGAQLERKFFGAGAPSAAPLAEAAGTFRATAQQLKTFSIEPVHTHAFVSEEFTEGKIAFNADRAVSVISPYSGRVARVLSSPGDVVKAGAGLALIEASEFVQAQNDLKVAAAQLHLARLNESRKQALYEAKGGSLQDWQQAQADLAAAEAALGAVRNRLTILGKSPEDIERLEAAARIQPAATLVAPIAGVVVERQVGPGQYLQAGGTPVFTIADPASVWLVANVREADVEHIHLGQSVEVRVLAYPKRTFAAKLNYIAAIVDPGTHRLTVRAVIDNADRALKPEMFASFRIVTSDADESPAIPQAAVIYEGDAAHVWVVAADGLLTYRRVRTGRSDRGLTEILDGLTLNERVVTRGGLFVDQAAAPAAT